MDDKGILVAHGKIHEGWLTVAWKRQVESYALASTAGAKALDAEASAQWGLDPFALVESAGRTCAEAFIRSVSPCDCPCHDREFTVLAGSGNNAADALVMLRALILGDHADPGSCSVFIGRMPGSGGTAERTPLLQVVLAVRKLGVSVKAWDEGKTDLAARPLTGRRWVVIDGITGTGLDGPLRGTALEMAEAANALSQKPNGPTVVSIDMPSGSFDGWRSGMPIVAANDTLAIEPQKLCIYAPSVRPNAGAILPVVGIFPPELTTKYRDAELLSWKSASVRIKPVPQTAHKYGRGLVEIRAGSPGASGAARLAALGSQAAGAGIVRLIVDASLYAIVAGACSGVMVVPDDATSSEASKEGEGRFMPAALLLGPGWGKGEDRMRLLESYLPSEEKGIPLVLDADAIALAKGTAFHGNAILTPHVGEFAFCTGLPKEEILGTDIIRLLRGFAAEKKATVLLKSHVMYVASPDGRLGVIDGMNPVLAAGGSGDVLAGFCAAIAARSAQEGVFDGYTCACAAASLLVQAAESEGIAGNFIDPGELARAAAAIAGNAWIRREQ